MELHTNKQNSAQIVIYN